jgi:hypothetical protein
VNRDGERCRIGADQCGDGELEAGLRRDLGEEIMTKAGLYYIYFMFGFDGEDRSKRGKMGGEKRGLGKRGVKRNRKEIGAE